jgi:hypothetical protein
MKNLILLVVFLVTGFSVASAQNSVTTISGNVTEVNHPVALFNSDDGSVYKMFLGPYWFWKNSGYSLLLERSTVKGVIDGKTIHPYEITQNGNTIKLKDENGIAVWGGKSNGKGRGCCNGPCRFNGNNQQNNGNGYGRGNCPNCPNCPYNKSK